MNVPPCCFTGYPPGVSRTGRDPAIKSRFGLEIKTDIPIERVRPGDYAALAVPGGFHSHGFNEAYDDRLKELATGIHGAGGWIATFCVGILPVAEAGLLEGRKAVSYPYSRNHDNLARLKELGASVATDQVVIDDRIISCAGPAASLEVAWQLLEGLIGKAHCAEVKRLMCVRSPD